MFSSIIKTISKPFDKGGNQPGATHQGTPPGRSDRLEDGFLLVGNTASERSTVYASNFQTNAVDAPPRYNDALGGDGLPTYRQYATSMETYSPTIDVSRNPLIQSGNPMQTGLPTVQTGSSNYEGQGDSSNRTAISDVPFVLGCGFGPSTMLRDIRNSNVLNMKTFDWSDFEYDFGLEMAFLCEHDGFRENGMMDVSD